MNDETPDRIERRALFRSSRSRVWRAISDVREFCRWFRLELDGAFAEGAVVRGHVTYPGFEHIQVEMHIERIAPEELFAYRWHPMTPDPDLDYSGEPLTLVEFRLSEDEGGTSLTIVESGFSKLPEGRREEAYSEHSEGWAEQVENIREYVERG